MRALLARFAVVQSIGIALCSCPASAASLESSIDNILQRSFKAGDFSGNVLIARQDRILYEKSFGLANREWNIPNDAQTEFEIGSMTRQFTALLVLQFVNEGRIRLDGRITDYLPWYRRDTGGRVTIHQLLTHTSGIPDFLRSTGFSDGPESRRAYSVPEFAMSHCSGDLQFEPGSKFEYSNPGYFLLGAILEGVSNESYENLLSKRIFQPLGMERSGYTHTSSILPHRAAGYERTPAGPVNARYYDMSIPFSAGALYSTARDLYLWDRALYTERLLPDNLKSLMFNPHLENYGYGWDVFVPLPGTPYGGEQMLMHGGAIFGFQSLIQRIPGRREFIVLLDNSDSPKLLNLALEIRQVLAAHAHK